MEISIGTMVLVPAIAVAAPLLVRAIGKWVAIPLVVFEIVLGLLLGPAVLGWIVPDDFMTLLADFGLAMLFFLAGNEIDFRAIRGRPLSRAAIGWIISLAAGIGLATLLAADLPAAAFIGIALTSTALGTIMPVLRDSGDLGTPFGIAVIALGAVGEFGPLLAISIFLSGRSPLLATVVLLSFAVIAGIAIWLAAKGVGKRMHRVITATLHTSGQFAVRLVIFVLLALVALSIVLDLDMLLGAFTAGVLYRLLISGAPKRDIEVVETKLEAVGYGFLVPVFFINTGVAFDLESLFADARTTVLLPVFLVLLLVVRGLPSLLAAPAGSSRRDLVATALFGATGLPIIVAVTAIGVDNGDLPSGTAAALVGAGMLSVLLFPLIALAIRKGRSDAATRTAEDDPFVPVEG
ncbi:Kef-type K+ transport system membrane component KefB [Agromyces cerinus]|uniref:cation:proton antiporter n=1 Tax=Agromyces cerinus TaxID=33878 RepID=UPI00195693AC|nr:cation:proton antiporter [Agromyces cerinus]MBM7830305.1 Kef-type K+ transport system membrane component KefB [Agromyces cerinus]